MGWKAPEPGFIVDTPTPEMQQRFREEQCQEHVYLVDMWADPMVAICIHCGATQTSRS